MSSSESYSQSSTSSFQNDTTDSTDSLSKMTTPVKPRTNSGQPFNVESMKESHNRDLEDLVQNNISVDMFAEKVWGLSPEHSQAILHASFELREESLSNYKKVFDPKSNLRESDLHQPFREISRGLLRDVCKLLSVDFTTLETYLWDGHGNVYIHHDPRPTDASMRKPDMLEVFIPAAKDNESAVNPDGPLVPKQTPVPTWAHVRAPLEFKKRDARTKLESIKEDDQGPSTSGRSGASSKIERSGRRTSTKDSMPPSVSTKASGRTGSKRSGSPSSSSTHQDRKRRKKNAIPTKEAQLTNYALECLYAGNRHYVTGIFVDGFNITFHYYDRSGVMRTTPFDFGKPSGTNQLALALFALSRCNMTQAGFDPYLYRFSGKVDQPIEDSTVTTLARPLFQLGQVCYRFPSQTAGGDDPIFVPQHIISQYRGTAGRGTFVADVLRGFKGNTLDKRLYALKQSWQYTTRMHEGDIISRLLERIPEWRNHLPEPIFYTTISALDLDIPRLQIYKALMKQGIQVKSIDQGRDLHVFATNRYKNIWKAKNVEEFKQIFVDCVECHYHAYNKGRVLHRDISDNNLMIYQPGETDKGDETINDKQDSATEAISDKQARGILNDFDMAAILGEDGETVPANPNHHHITGTLPFMACDLLTPNKDHPNFPKGHLYRYDLESFFYVLVFAASTYDLANGRRLPIPSHSPLVKWSEIDNAEDSKIRFFGTDGDRIIGGQIRREWQDMWNTWVMPLYDFFMDAFHEAHVASRKGNLDYNYTTMNGRLTFEKFMETVQIEPRKLGAN